MNNNKSDHLISLDPTLERVKNASLNSFKEMVKSHLARLIEIESGFDFDSIESTSNEHYSDTIFGAPLTHEGICCMSQLIQHIKKDENIISQGIFRQSGSILRQNQLQALLSKGETVSIDETYNVYTCCDVLKKYVRELPKPLLTDVMSPLFFATTQITCEDKRLNALRLLILLLPSSNRIFLADLMDLFGAVVAHADKNLMTAHNIAIIFGPHFFVAREIKQRDQLDLLGQVQAVFEFMIHKGMDLFQPPPELLADADVFLANLEKKLKEKAVATNLMSTTSLIPAPKFCATPSTSYNSEDYTKQQLAELMAAMMSEMNNKQSNKPNHKPKKWLSRLNRENTTKLKSGGDDTPLLQRDRTQQQLVKEAIKARAAANGKKSNLKNIFKKTFGTTEKTNKIITGTSLASNSPSPSIKSFNSFYNAEAPSPRSIVPVMVTPLITNEVRRSLTVKPEVFSAKNATPVRRKPTLAQASESSKSRRLSKSQSFKVTPVVDLKNGGEEIPAQREDTPKRPARGALKRNRTYVNVKPSLPPKPLKCSKTSVSAAEVRLPMANSFKLKTFKSETLKPTWSSNVNVNECDELSKTSTTSLLQEELIQVKKERKVTKITAKFENNRRERVSACSPVVSEEYVDLVKIPLREKSNQATLVSIGTVAGKTIIKSVHPAASVMAKLHKAKMPTPPPPRPVRPCSVIGRKVVL